MGGMVLETNMNEIVAQIEAQNRLEKSEVRKQLHLCPDWVQGGARACVEHVELGWAVYSGWAWVGCVDLCLLCGLLFSESLGVVPTLSFLVCLH